MAGAEKSGQSSDSHDQGAEASPGYQGAKSSAVDSNAEDDLSSDVPYRRAASI